MPLCKKKTRPSAPLSSTKLAGDAAAQRLDVLLQAHHLADHFLQKPSADSHATGVYTPAPADESPADQPAPFTEAAGMRIGPYKLLQRIGEGGMGSVWMAEQQEPVRRRVALKIIKAGMDSAQVVARFEAERQALALMDHPNIARVFDGGTTAAGRPYFVMELAATGSWCSPVSSSNRFEPHLVNYVGALAQGSTATVKIGERGFDELAVHTWTTVMEASLDGRYDTVKRDAMAELIEHEPGLRFDYGPMFISVVPESWSGLTAGVRFQFQSG